MRTRCRGGVFGGEAAFADADEGLAGAAAFTGANSWANLIAGTAQIQREGAGMVGRIRNDILNYGDVSPVIDPSLQNPQVHQWSFGVQRQLGGSTMIEAGYVGNRSTKFEVDRDLNIVGNQMLSRSPFFDQQRVNYLTASIPNPFRGLPGVRRPRQAPPFHLRRIRPERGRYHRKGSRASGGAGESVDRQQ